MSTLRISFRDYRTHKNDLPCFLPPSKIHRPIPKFICVSPLNTDFLKLQTPPQDWHWGDGAPAAAAHLQSLHLSLERTPALVPPATPAKMWVSVPVPAALPSISCSSRPSWVRTMSSVLLTFPPLEAQCRMYVWSCPCVGSLPIPQRAREFCASVNSPFIWSPTEVPVGKSSLLRS